MREVKAVYFGPGSLAREDWSLRIILIRAATARRYGSSPSVYDMTILTAVSEMPRVKRPGGWKYKLGRSYLLGTVGPLAQR